VHPVLSSRGRLIPYLSAWLLLSGILAAILVLPGGLSWGAGAAMAVPLSLLFGLLSLSCWYVCRAVPPRPSGLPRLVLTHTIAAAGFSGVWIFLARDLGHLLAINPAWEELPERVGAQMAVLFGMGILFYLLSAAFHYLLLSLEQAREADRQQTLLLVQARDAELRALKAQLHPHFLFNSLNSISALAGSAPEQAREMCVLLADFLRKSLGLGEKADITLGEELALAGAFLGVEKVRFGPRLSVEEAVDVECRSCRVPPLLLQPLVENAVTHGIATLEEGGVLRIEARNDEGRLRIVVENPYDEGGSTRRGSGLGLVNVRKRMAARFGDEAMVEIDKTPGRFRVTLGLPCAREES
jgi:signal transduction histidine kinase